MNKARIKRLSTFPWKPEVEVKDLPNATFEELARAIFARSACSLTIPEGSDDQHFKLLITWLNALDERRHTPQTHEMTEEEYAEHERKHKEEWEQQRAREERKDNDPDDQSGVVYFEASEIDKIYPKLDNRLDQLAELNQIHPENLTFYCHEEEAQMFSMHYKHPASYFVLRRIYGEISSLLTRKWARDQLSAYPWGSDYNAALFEADVETLETARDRLQKREPSPVTPEFKRQSLMLTLNIELKRYGSVPTGLLNQIERLENEIEAKEKV